MAAVNSTIPIEERRGMCSRCRYQRQLVSGVNMCQKYINTCQAVAWNCPGPDEKKKPEK